MDTTILKVTEGGMNNYFKVVEEVFEQKRIKNRFEIQKGSNYFHLSSQLIAADFELGVLSTNFYNNIVVDRIANERPDYYHFNMIKEGKIMQDYDNEEKTAEAGTNKGVFVYNGGFPLKSNIPANQDYKAIVFKVSKQAIAEIMPEAIPIIETLFENDEPTAYHTQLPIEMERLLTELYEFNSGIFGKNTMVLSRGLELFTMLLNSIKQLLEKDELHGLHIDDYNRLLLIKKEMLDNIEGKINVEEIAKQFAISKSKLQRDFKTLFDISVYQFFAQAKMDEAYRRLKTGKFTVMQVGYDLGYNSIPKFSIMFKKNKGINPSDVIPG
nr:AraC family transcriptional regulator [uncultured Carboxylicivirga sp.]